MTEEELRKLLISERTKATEPFAAMPEMTDKAKAWSAVAEKNAEIERLRAQRDRLLAALKVYRDDGHCPTCTADGGCFSNHRPGCAFLAARAAIAAVEEKP